MITLLLIIIGLIAGICLVIPTCKQIPESVNLKSKYWRKVQTHNIIKLTIGGHYKCSCYDTTNLWRFWRSHYKSSKYYKPLTIKFDDDSEMTI